MKRTDFHYELPTELIAQEPRARGRSRMMIVTPEAGPPRLEHARFDAFPSLLEAGDVLVINDTRVIPARLYAEPKGQMTRRVELLLTQERAPLLWSAWCRPAKRVREGDVLRFSPLLVATVTGKDEDGSVSVRFAIERPDMPAAEMEHAVRQEIERIGVMPLPPYISRTQPDEHDKETYQTVYAAEPGAIAAPTAGLHFTQEILDAIAERGIEIARVTLHVGIGTFKPVKVEEVGEHRMDSERYDVPERSAAILNRALLDRRRIVAVGTTSVRTIESAVQRGDGRVAAGGGETSIFITPGVPFRAVDALLTNFHLPESTLIMLVSAFAGMRTTRVAYETAIRERYFFYSYGDCMFLTRRGSW